MSPMGEEEELVSGKESIFRGANLALLDKSTLLDLAGKSSHVRISGVARKWFLGLTCISQF